MATIPSPAWPLAEGALCKDLLDLLQEAFQQRQLKKGANETIKTLARGTGQLTVLAADTAPISIVVAVTILSQDKNVPYIWVPSRVALGRACGITRSVVAASITTNEASEINKRVKKMRERIDDTFV